MFVCADMAKHQGRLKGAKNVTRKNDPPDAAYNKLPDHEKRIASSSSSIPFQWWPIRDGS